ncbi:MAG: NAD-dependent epimerase/dehydratase family protein [Alphaproteobacteria bacterium]|nr:NAD-dependent epimerase/dehydratase family protein [Alphaproteobacteria bacterium]
MTKTALVIGAAGAFGGQAAQALLAHGWRVRALQRSPDAARKATPGDVDWRKGDAMEREDVRRAAEGVQVIVHAANPAGYRNWGGTILPMIDNTIAASIAEGARMLIAGSVYNYGPDARGRIAEEAPQNPLTRKGKLRVELERRLRSAAQEGGKSVVLRAGDFFGGRAGGNWLGGVIFPAGKPVTRLMYPGPLAAPHAFAYLPDLAEAAARLLDREDELAAVASFHFAGHAITGHDLVETLRRVTGRKPAVLPFPWLAVAAAGPFNETLREVYEMRYLWREDVLLDNGRLTAAIGPEPHTPLDDALRTTLIALGCLQAAPTAVAA